MLPWIPEQQHLPLNCPNYIPHAQGFISILGIDNPFGKEYTQLQSVKQN